jgi:Rrf2 family protein
MISKKTKYALNALVHLAKRRDEGPVLISQIAGTENIPQKFLEAILLDMRNAGFLRSKKGKGGGYYMHKDPEEINIADIMRLFDGPIALLPCVTHQYYEKCEECVDETTCGIRDVFAELRNETVKLLKASTVAEIIRREKKLKESHST